MTIKAKDLLNHTEQNWLVDCIRKAEKHTTGEIRVHLEDVADIHSFDRAAEVFAALHMHETRYRNGVLVYVEFCQHNFVILGDMAFNSKADEGFWEGLSKELSHHFQQARYFEGLAFTVKKIGEVLKNHFPIGEKDNPNELPDSISFG